MENVNAKLFGRIAKVMADVRQLPQDGFNKHDRYKYTTAAMAVQKIGTAMAEHGLVIIPVVITEDTQKPQGEKAHYSVVEFEFHICDVDGNAFATRWTGRGVNYGAPDKALKTAMTNANTTFLLKLFQVGAGDDDPEIDGFSGKQAAGGTTNTDSRRKQPPVVTGSKCPTCHAPEGKPHASTCPHVGPSSLDEVPKMSDDGPKHDAWNSIPDAPSEKPQKPSVLLHKTIKEFFPKDTDDARHWLVEKYTTAATPDNVRTSSKDLTDKECLAIAKALTAKPEDYQDRYSAHVEARTEAQEGSKPKTTSNQKKAG